MRLSLVVSPVVDGARLDAWLKTAGFQSVTHLSSSRKAGTASELWRNVLESDGTAILYFAQIEGGTEETFRFCIEKHKPYKLIDAEEVSAERAACLLASFVQHYGIEVLNVAGPRQSKAPHAHTYAHAVINLLLQDRKEPKR